MLVQKQPFSGLDTDSDLAFMAEGSYRYALNVHVGSSEGGNIGSIETVKGNTIVNFSLPSGTNKEIGSYEDREGNRVLYFIYNSSGNHGIYEFNASTNTVTKLFEWSGLNFQSNKLITGIGFVGGLLSWCDDYNPNRLLDLNNIDSYPQPYTEEMITLIKRPPNLPPIVQRAKDAGYTNNYILKKTFQFALRYIYEDNSKSTLSPYSKLSVNTVVVSQQTITGGGTITPKQIVNPDDNNYIQVNLNITDLLASNHRFMVKKIEILVREENSGTFGIFKTLTRDEFTTSQTVNFYNDTNITPTDQTEVSKLYDSAPLKSAAHAIIKNRGYWGRNTEGFDVSNDLTAAFTPTYSDIINSSNGLVNTGVLGDRVFKDRGVFNFGVVWFDMYMRSSGVQFNDSFTARINANTNNRFAKVCTSLQMNISGTPPDWAHYYGIVRTKNLNQGTFLQLHISDIKYLDSYDSSGNAVYRETYSASDVNLETHLGFNAGKYANISYTYEEGDRIFIYYFDSSGNPYTVDLPIKGVFYGSTIVSTLNTIQGPRNATEIIKQQVDVAKIIVENFNFRKQQTCFAEIYNPTKQNGLFYEIGEIHKVNDPGTPSRALSQTSFAIHNGDVYFTLRNIEKARVPKSSPPAYYIKTLPVETMGLFDENYNVNNSDIGRAITILSDEKQEVKETTIRFSNLYVQESTINGISSFEGLNEKPLPLEYGPIYKLQVASNTESDSNVLLSIHSKETASLYIEEAVFSDIAGKTTVALSNDVIGAVRALRGSYGTTNPESVVQNDGVVYGWDANKGVVWRYSLDGMTPISDIFMKKYFYDKSRTLLPLSTARAFGVIDPYFNEYIVTFDPGNGDPAETIAFNEKTNRWTTFYSFAAEGYQKINTKLISFKNGSLYIHGSNTTCGNFYGQQYTFKVKPTCNIEPSKTKVLLNVGTESPEIWVAISITNPKGQLSDLKASDYKRLENGFSANVLRDRNTPAISAPKIALLHGDTMRDVVFETMLECTSTEITTLRFANFKVIPSERNNW